MSRTWQVSNYQRYDKAIEVVGPLYLEIDYDDVNTDAVDVLIPRFLDILNRHWSPPTRYFCVDPDEDKEIPRPGATSSWDTLMCWSTMLEIEGPCPVCGGPTELREVDAG